MNHGLNRLGRFRIESGGMRAHSKGFAKFEWLPDSRSAWSAAYSTAFSSDRSLAGSDQAPSH